VHTKVGMRLPFSMFLAICEGARPPELRRSENSSAIFRVSKECQDQNSEQYSSDPGIRVGGAPSVGGFIGEDWRSLLRTHAKDLLFVARTKNTRFGHDLCQSASKNCTPNDTR
jgi:hypothetical protein